MNSSLEILTRAAQDPTLSESRLEEYATNYELAKVVASNPNITVPLLIKLASDHPREVATNPALLLNAVSDTQFLERLASTNAYDGSGRISGLVLDLLVAEADCPEPVVSYAVENPHPSTYRALLQNPRLTAEQLLRMEETVRTKRLSNVRIVDVQLHANHPNPPKRSPRRLFLDALKRLKPSTTASLYAFNDPGLPFDVRELLVDQDPERLLPYCQHPKLLGEYVSHESTEVRCAVARAEDLTDELFEQLLADPETLVRVKLAQNRRIPAWVALALAQDEKQQVRRSLGSNAGIPVAALDYLVEHDPACWPDVLRNPLSTSAHVKHVIAQLESLSSQERLNRLSFLSQPFIRHADTPPELLVEIHELLKKRRSQFESVGSHPNLPVEWMWELARSDSRTDRTELAENPSVPLEVLEFLRADPSSGVRATLLERPDLPSEWVEAFCDDPDVNVAAKAERRRAGKPVAATQPAPPESFQSARRLARSLPGSDWPALASRTDLQVEDYEFFVTQGDWPARLAVALNPGTPAHLLEALRDDRRPLVRSAMESRAA